jgi:hypothetical protein
MVVLLNTMYGGNLPPSAVHANITVNLFFSFPVFVMLVDFALFVVIVVADGKSNVIGV